MPSRLANGSGSSAHLLPRKSLRLPFHYFLTAVRDRLIDDIVSTSRKGSDARQVVRLRGGFLLGPSPASSEWSAGWEHHARTRPLIYSQLQIHLSQPPTTSSCARLLVHPVLRPTFYLPLHACLPLPSGAPITLLPHGVPAHYLHLYTGPTSALTSQFETSLMGLGAGDWKGAIEAGISIATSSASVCGDGQLPSYVIAWLSVQNKQGEDKGMPIIWPVRLCLSYHPSSPAPHARTSLPWNPELPTQLQASPPPPPPAVPLTLYNLEVQPPLYADGRTTPQQHATPRLPDTAHLRTPVSRRRRTLTSSPTAESLRAFRTMTLSTKPYARGMQNVATEVGGYVDSVAKDRDRERERMKREREGASARGRATSISGPPPNTMQLTPDVPKTEQPAVITPAATSSPAPPDDVPMDEDTGHTLDSSQDSSLNSLFSPPTDAATPFPDSVESILIPSDSHLSAEPIDLSVLQPAPEGFAADPIGTFDDAFGGFTAPWPQPTTSDFMDIGMKYDIGFNMNMDSLSHSRPGDRGGDTFDMDDGFGVFTDDDFNFFDAPAVQARPGAISTIPMQVDSVIKASEGLTPAAGPAPLGFSPQRSGDIMHISGPGPPLLSISQSSAWSHHGLAEGFTPRDFHAFDSIPPAPELLPPSPSQTPSSHSAPATPTVQLSDHDDHAGGQKLGYPSLGASIFDPIPFAPSHRINDSKYAFGKFALPSPPDDVERAQAMFFPSSGLSPAGGWRDRYSAATDPRIGIMRKLIGVKRKSFTQGVRPVRMSPSWVREHEEWESNTPSPSVEETKSDGESDDDEPWADEDEQVPDSRPSTPPPSYLPMGPTLLHTNFHHSRLLPLCSPLRPPGMVLEPPANITVPISVPTPVSPAALVGAASEKSKSLEAAAQLLVREVVENSAWADAWRINAAVSSVVPRPSAEVWQTDVKRAALLLEGVRGMQPTVDLCTLIGLEHPPPEVNGPLTSPPLIMLEPPVLAVGKADSIIQVLPTALRFWEKLGLRPRAGQKDVNAYVFYESANDEREVEIAHWLDRVSAAYSARNLGTHSAGNSAGCVRPGLVPTRFDSIKKTLVNFVATLAPMPEAYFVFYVVTPPSMVGLTSTPLRQILSAIKRTMKAHPGHGILFHFVPEAFTTGGLADPRALHGGLELFVHSVYDRILQPVERSMSRILGASGARIRSSFHAPAYALTGKIATNSGQGSNGGHMVTFRLDSHPSSLDVVDRHALLHVGYHVTPCGRWVLAACVDERGEEYELGVWLTPTESVESFVVSQVWSFSRAFAARANVEWRIVVAKLGTMGESELDAWIMHLDQAMSNLLETAPPVQVTLLTVECQNSWTLLTPTSVTGTKPTQLYTAAYSRSTPRVPSGAMFADSAYTSYAVFPLGELGCIPALSPVIKCGSGPGSADTSSISDFEDEEPLLHSQPYLRVTGSSTLISVPAGADYTAVSMVHIYRLHSVSSPKVMMPKRIDSVEVQDEEVQTLRDITHNYHALAVLAYSKWKLQEHPGLPIHLAALMTMKMALMGGGVETTL
ncbi:uncharacterized protein FIBRA_03087 [Fibroporia radiculosa]|uniref:Mediator of RNA polymerase II transcription subunit 13 n=1 Tax=Fibroporia radiculosa TaxID=599839 RepID=J4H276_9APHY|nr:uncharacterized protein FIBRA_03087 [Fibroporia radiculosa]CCM01039.1 predicted protein [Fibroporia radiculosa]